MGRLSAAGSNEKSVEEMSLSRQTMDLKVLGNAFFWIYLTLIERALFLIF